jgi:hypothetical protein
VKIRGRLKATDPNVIAKATLDALTEKEKNPAAVALGRLGGLKGGRARVDSMTAKQRKQSAIKAAKARWSKKSV